MTTMTKKPVNHKDIAEYLNIAQSTVSRALDPAKSHLISEATRTKIVAAADKLGFRANIYAQRMRKLKTDTLTLIIDSQQLYGRAYPDFHVHHEALIWDMIFGVISYCGENNFDVKLLPLLTREDSEIKDTSKHLGYPYSDGVIFYGYKYLEKARNFITAQKIPSVVMSTSKFYPENEVSVDPAIGIRQAIRYLVDKGHRKIAFCQLKTNYEFVNLRRTVFEDKMKELGLWDPRLIYSATCESDIKNFVADNNVLNSFSAILCVNDAMADRWLRELKYAGLSVPEDKAVIGFDNNPLYPELSTIDVPRKEIGQKAAEILIELVKKQKNTSQTIVKESKFILRKSC